MNAERVPGVSSRRVAGVLLEHGLYLTLDDGARITLESTIEVTATGPRGSSLTPGSEGRTVSPQVPRPEVLPAWAELEGLTVRGLQVDDGRLEIRLEDRVLVVRPDPDYEAWNVRAADGELVVCCPGGELAHWASTRQAD